MVDAGVQIPLDALRSEPERQARAEHSPSLGARARTEKEIAR